RRVLTGGWPQSERGGHHRDRDEHRASNPSWHVISPGPYQGIAQAYCQASLSRASPCRLAIMPTSIVVVDNPSVKQVAGQPGRIYCSNRVATKPFTRILCSAAYA